MDARRTFRRAEVQDVAVLAEHVDLLHTGDGLHVELLERALELLVVLRGSRLRLPNDLSTDSPLSTYLTIHTHINGLLLRHWPKFAQKLNSRSPILLAAACACSFASLAGSIVFGVEDRG